MKKPTIRWNPILPAIADVKYDGTFQFVKDGKLVDTKGKITEFPNLPKQGFWIGELFHGKGKNNDIYKIKSSTDLHVVIYAKLPYRNEEENDKVLIERFRPERKVVKTKEELDIFYHDVLNRGYEGIVVKPLKLPMEFWAKLKISDESTFVVVSVEKLRFEVDVGNGNVCGIAKCLTDEITVGDIVTIKYQGMTENNIPRNPTLKREG